MSWLEKTVHVALLSVSVTACCILWDLKFSSAPGSAKSAGLPAVLARELENFQPGAHAPRLAPPPSARLALHLVLSSTCPHCLRQQGLYEQLAALCRTPSRLAFRVYAKDGAAAVGAAFPSLQAHLAPHASPESVPLSVSPGLILVSPSGRILFSKFGALNSE